jgi:galactokinase
MEHISAFAPGRIELLGNHTDYNQGVVLGAALDRGLTVSGRLRDDGRIEIDSKLIGQIDIGVDRVIRQDGAPWANYSLGVFRELLDLGMPGDGFEAEIEGDLPIGRGLSSSAALEVATALFLLKLHRRQVQPMELAKLCQRAEHRFAGVRSGLMDQVMSIFGRADHAIYFDTRSEEIRLIPFPPDLALIVAESGTQRNLATGDYNRRRNETHVAAVSLGVKALRDLTVSALDVRTDVDPVLRRRARHVIGENAGVHRALELLETGDATALGQLLNQSHQSSRENFENSTPELDLLVEIANKVPGILGARLTGGGFGGAIVALCSRTEAHDAARKIGELYTQETGIASEIFVSRIGPGAH